MSWVTNNEWLEVKTKDPIHWKELVRFAVLYKPERPRILAVALVASVGSSIYFAIPYIFTGAQQSLRTHDFKSLFLLMSLYGVVLCLQTGATYATKRLQAAISTSLNRLITLNYYQKLLNIRVADFLEFKSRTNLFQRLIDALAVTSQATEVLTQSLQAIIVFGITLAIISHVSPRMSLIVLIGQLVLFSFVVLRSPSLRQKRQRLLAANYPLVSKMLEVIEGLLTIKTLTATVRVSSDVDALVSAKCKAEYNEAVCDVGISQGAMLISHLITLLTLTVAFVSAAKGSLSFQLFSFRVRRNASQISFSSRKCAPCRMLGRLRDSDVTLTSPSPQLSKIPRPNLEMEYTAPL